MIALFLSQPVLAFSFFNTEQAATQNSSSVLSPGDFQASISKIEQQKKTGLAAQLKDNLTNTQVPLLPMNTIKNNKMLNDSNIPNNNQQNNNVVNPAQDTVSPTSGTQSNTNNVYSGFNTPSNADNASNKSAPGSSSWSIY
jgi:hypothetical protein